MSFTLDLLPHLVVTMQIYYLNINNISIFVLNKGKLFLAYLIVYWWRIKRGRWKR
jgi:hypothetical protein